MAWYISGSGIALGGIVTSALVSQTTISVMPSWIGYVLAGVTVVSLFLGNRADSYSTRAVETQREAENVQHQLDLDYQEKKRAHQQQLEHEAEIIYWRGVAQGNLGGGEVVIVPPPNPRRRTEVEIARVANLRAYATVQNGDIEADDMERVVMEPVHVAERAGVAPRKDASAPIKPPQRKGTWIKVRRRVDRSKSPADARPPAAEKEEDVLLEPVASATGVQQEIEVVVEPADEEKK